MNATVHADPRARKRVIFIILTIVLGGSAYLYWFTGFLQDMERLSETEWEAAFGKLWPLLLVTTASLLGLSTALASILTYLAVRVYRTAQYPPPGIRMLWDTPLRTGREARRAALCMLLLAVGPIAYGVGMTWFLWHTPEVNLIPPTWKA